VDEDEAWRIAIVLSEVAKYTYQQQRDAEGNRGNHIGGKADFSMDDEDAWDIDMVEVREDR
jgi:hypothetical protein